MDNSRALRIAGKSLPRAGAALSAGSNFVLEDQDNYTAAVETGTEILFAAGAAAIASLLCTATAGVGCVLIGVRVGIAGLFAGSATGEAVGPHGGAVRHWIPPLRP